MLADQKHENDSNLDIFIGVCNNADKGSMLGLPPDNCKILLSDGVTRIAPLEIRELNFMKMDTEFMFPFFNRWQKFYRLRFPRQTSESVSLIFTGPSGKLTLSWDNVLYLQ
jgi:hypothetical protein